MNIDHIKEENPISTTPYRSGYLVDPFTNDHMEITDYIVKYLSDKESLSNKEIDLHLKELSNLQGTPEALYFSRAIELLLDKGIITEKLRSICLDSPRLALSFLFAFPDAKRKPFVSIIATKASCSLLYAMHVVKDRFLEGEEEIIKCKLAMPTYLKFLKTNNIRTNFK